MLQNCNLSRGECAIFDDVISLMLKSAKVCASTIKNSSNKAKRGTFAVIAVFAILASLTFTGARIAYNVNYSGSVIATVSSKKQFDDALALVVKMVNSNEVNDVVKEPTFNATVVLNEDINNVNEVADAIIENTDEIVEALKLKVDGVVVACVEKATLDNIIAERLNCYNVFGAECTSRFSKDVELESGYYMANGLDNKHFAKRLVDSLDVITQIRKTSEVMVPYQSIIQETKEQVVGYKETTVAGVSGVSRVTQDVLMLNGEVQSCVDVDTQVIIAPVNEVIVKGVAKTLLSAQQRQQANSAGFAFPLPAGTWQVSSYYGDGRNHKGIDLCAPSGTSIYAVADGTVVFSGWRGAYGNCVVVQHSNGMQTLYAHASQNCCATGDTVSQGEVIALVGTTGQSTGNHLHFEVIVNGVNVNPAPYINLG